MNSMYDLLQDVPVAGTNVMLSRKQGKAIPKVVDGLKPKRPPIKEGAHLFTPEELLTLHVDETRVNGRVLGYQRELDPLHARRIAQYLRDGKLVPTLEVALDGRGRLYLVDGQQRAAAGIMARVSLVGIIQRLDKNQQAELFASQRRAKIINPNVLVLAGSGPFERYVQEAVASESPSHPWHGIVSPSRHSKTRVGPYALFQMLIRYVGNAEGQGASRRTSTDDRWDHGLADELAPLIKCFGNKATNPMAFRPFALQAIAGSAMWVFRRRDREPDDYERWQRHMPQFQFHLWPHLRRQLELTDQLLVHWNKGLRGKRRVGRPA